MNKFLIQTISNFLKTNCSTTLAILVRYFQKFCGKISGLSFSGPGPLFFHPPDIYFKIKQQCFENNCAKENLSGKGGFLHFFHKIPDPSIRQMIIPVERFVEVPYFAKQRS